MSDIKAILKILDILDELIESVDMEYEDKAVLLEELEDIKKSLIK